MGPNSNPSRCRLVSALVRGFTILEIMVVLVIILIIASMLLPAYSAYLGRMDEARCLANLRNLHLAASGYLLANESWPQIPPKLLVDNEKGYARAWVSSLAPFGAPHSSWICPTIQRSMNKSMDTIDKDENYRVDFIATPFSEHPGAPRASMTHPWFLERSGVHSRGNLVILANGTTLSLRDMTDGTFGK